MQDAQLEKDGSWPKKEQMPKNVWVIIRGPTLFLVVFLVGQFPSLGIQVIKYWSMSDYCGINANAYAMFVCLFFSPFSLSGWVGKCVCAATVLPMPMDTMFGYNSLPHSRSPVIFFIFFCVYICLLYFSSEQYF